MSISLAILLFKTKVLSATDTNTKSFFGSEIVPGEDFEVLNPNVMSKIAKSGTQMLKIRKNHSGTLTYCFLYFICLLFLIVLPRLAIREQLL